MHGVVSLLSKPYYQQVKAIWDTLDREMGIRGVLTTPFPHFSYHVAEHYDLPEIGPMLEKFARETAPFTVQTTGLGIFTGGLKPIVYVNVARSPQLSAMNADLWSLLAERSAGIVDYYHPQEWVPHVTLAHGDFGSAELPQLIDILSGYEFAWTLTVNNLTLLYTDDTIQQDDIQFQFPLTG